MAPIAPTQPLQPLTQPPAPPAPVRPAVAGGRSAFAELQAGMKAQQPSHATFILRMGPSGSFSAHYEPSKPSAAAAAAASWSGVTVLKCQGAADLCLSLVADASAAPRTAVAAADAAAAGSAQSGGGGGAGAAGGARGSGGGIFPGEAASEVGNGREWGAGGAADNPKPGLSLLKSAVQKAVRLGRARVPPQPAQRLPSADWHRRPLAGQSPSSLPP